MDPMDTTPATELPIADKTEQLAALDPADAPDLADELADTLAAALDDADEPSAPAEEPT